MKEFIEMFSWNISEFMKDLFTKSKEYESIYAEGCIVWDPFVIVLEMYVLYLGKIICVFLKLEEKMSYAGKIKCRNSISAFSEKSKNQSIIYTQRILYDCPKNIFGKPHMYRGESVFRTAPIKKPNLFEL